MPKVTLGLLAMALFVQLVVAQTTMPGDSLSGNFEPGTVAKGLISTDMPSPDVLSPVLNTTTPQKPPTPEQYPFTTPSVDPGKVSTDQPPAIKTTTKASNHQPGSTTKPLSGFTDTASSLSKVVKVIAGVVVGIVCIIPILLCMTSSKRAKLALFHAPHNRAAQPDVDETVIDIVEGTPTDSAVDLNCVKPSHGQSPPAISKPPVCDAAEVALCHSILQAIISGDHGVIDLHEKEILTTIRTSTGDPLFIALFHMKLFEAAATLLQKCKPNVAAVRDDSQSTPLHIAAKMDGVPSELLEQLVLASANVMDAQDRACATPLIHAVRQGNQALVILLLDAKADPNIQDAYGQTPLHVATVNGHVQIADTLVRRRDTMANVLDHHGRTPLHWAVALDDVTMTRTLVEARKPILAADTAQGETVLHIATREGNAVIVDIILQEAKARDVKKLLVAKTPAEETALSIAMSLKHKDISQLLEAQALAHGVTIPAPCISNPIPATSSIDGSVTASGGDASSPSHTSPVGATEVCSVSATTPSHLSVDLSDQCCNPVLFQTTQSTIDQAMGVNLDGLLDSRISDFHLDLEADEIV
eukprot:m.60348 g.60348  ORF g.60348 m.60348 type:complete len:587 (+) comp11809_c1_seq3:401-2161(+)